MYYFQSSIKHYVVITIIDIKLYSVQILQRILTL